MKNSLKQIKKAGEAAAALLERAIEKRTMPGAAFCLFDHEGPMLTLLRGRLHYGEWAEPVTDRTIFDLASLTKPLATALCAMYLADRGLLDLDSPVSELLPAGGPSATSIRRLLTHSSGLPAHEKLSVHPGLSSGMKRGSIDRQRLASYLVGLLNGPQAEIPTYSDLGFILLGMALEEAGGKALDALFLEVIGGLFPDESGHLEGLGLWPETALKKSRPYLCIAPTGWCPDRKRMLLGQVHDLNAWLMGGFAGHAGLFGTISGTARLLVRLLRLYLGYDENHSLSKETLRRFWTPYSVPESPWCLGFDTPSPEGSSAGRLFSKRSVGHLGYTGTSFWIDLERGLGMILLANRTFPVDSPESRKGIKALRPALHDAVMEALI